MKYFTETCSETLRPGIRFLLGQECALCAFVCVYRVCFAVGGWGSDKLFMKLTKLSLLLSQKDL